MELVVILLIFLVGAICGGAVALTVLCHKSIGSLIIDTSDPDGPYLFLELHHDQSIAKLSHETFVMVKVNMANYIPHE